MEVNKMLFRCSSLGHLMTESRSKSDPISETTKTHLIDKFVSWKYGRQTDISNRYVIKGLTVEEDSLTLYSQYKKKFLKKNEEQISNDFISGTPDHYEGEEILKANLITDIKSSWDIFTFFRSKAKLNKMYYWQMQGYMALTGAKKATLAYCLVDTPDVMIQDEKRKLMWRMGLIDDSKEYLEACKEIDKLSVYTDIPIKVRVHEIHIETNDMEIERLYERIKYCREWIKQNLL